MTMSNCVVLYRHPGDILRMRAITLHTTIGEPVVTPHNLSLLRASTFGYHHIAVVTVGNNYRSRPIYSAASIPQSRMVFDLQRVYPQLDGRQTWELLWQLEDDTEAFIVWCTMLTLQIERNIGTRHSLWEFPRNNAS